MTARFDGLRSRPVGRTRHRQRRHAARGFGIWAALSVVLVAVVSVALLYVGSRVAILLALVPAAFVAGIALQAGLDRRALGFILTWAGLVLPFVVVEARSVENVQAGLVTPLNVVQGLGPIVLFISAWLTCRKRMLPLRRREPALLVFGTVCALSTMWSVQPLASALRAGQLIVAFLLLILLVRQLGPPSAVVRHLVGGVYVAIAIVLLGLAVDPGAALSPESAYDFARQTTVHGSFRLQGLVPYIHPDLVGFLAAVALLTLVAGFGPRWSLTQPRRALIGVGSSAALLLSGTRSALVLLLVGLVVLAVLDARSRSRVLVLAMAAVAALLVIPAIHGPLLEYLRRGQDPRTLATLTGRTVTWQGALAAWGKRPLTGYGYYAGHRFLDFAAGRNLSNLDNMYIETLVDVGLFGLGALVAFLVAGMGFLVRSARCSARSVSIAIVIAALVGAAVNPSMQTPGVALIVAGGLLLAPWVPSARGRAPQGDLPEHVPKRVVRRPG